MKKQRARFSPDVEKDVRARLTKIASLAEEAMASLEIPSDADDSELILSLLDDLQADARQALSVWCEEQWTVWPESNPRTT